jgi:predicted permease
MFATGENQRVNWRQIFKDIFSFPPFIAFCIALIISFLQIKYNPVFEEILGKIGAPFSCIALVSIGFQMNFQVEKSNISPLLFGLFYKLILAPVLIFFLYFVCFGQNNLGAKISVFGSMLGSMNTIGIIAIRKGLNEKLIMQLLAMSIPLSLVFLFLVKIMIM